MNKVINEFKALSLKKKIQLFIAMVATVALVVAVPVYAWFTNLKKAAEMYKIKYPNALYINAAHREDRVFFNLDGINTTSNYLMDLDDQYIKQSVTYNEGEEDEYTVDELIPINHKYYVFSVSGSNTSYFTLQLAHTNNNKFTYRVYSADQKTTLDSAESAVSGYSSMTNAEKMSRIIKYQTHTNSHSENSMQLDGDLFVNDQAPLLYYVRSASPLPLVDKNPDSVKAKQAEDDTSDTYYKKTFGDADPDDPNSNVEVSSIPTYAQVNVAVPAANKDFCQYFILEVEWNSEEQSGQTSKETDIVYLSVVRTASP